MGELYIEYEYWVAAAQLGFAMLGMGATLTVKDFQDVVREPKSFTIGALIQLALVPIVAYLFIHTMGLAGGIAVGVALFAAIPGGTTSNIFAYFARGNVPLSISITGVTTLACLVTTPFILGLLIVDYLPSDFVMPTRQIVSDIALTLLLPLCVGMVILSKLSAHAAWISKWSIRASLIGVLMIVVGSISAGRLDINAFGLSNVLLVVSFVLLLWLLSWLVVKLLGLAKPDRTTIEMEVLVRNVNLGVLIKASMFPAAAGSNQIGDMVLLTILLLGAVQLLLAAVMIFSRRAAA